jgi:hypothetical protein
MRYTMLVVDAMDGRVHGLPADTVTRDTWSTARGAGGPLLPLGFRSAEDVFFVSGDRWPELDGKPLRLASAAPSLRAPEAHVPVHA